MAELTSNLDFKYVADKKYITDLTECIDLNELDYAWEANYNQRGLLMRILCQGKDKKSPIAELNMIEGVKFFTKEKEQSEVSEFSYHFYNSGHQMSLDNFYKFIDNFVNSFEHSEITAEYWKDINTSLDLFQYRYKKIEGMEFWSTEKGPKTDEELAEAIAKMSTGQTAYLSALIKAFRTDMKNGHAKGWIEELIKVLLKCLDADLSDVHSWAPVKHDNTNTVIEAVSGDLDDAITQVEYNSAPSFSTSSSNSSSLSGSISLLNLESTRDIETDACSPKGTRQQKKVVPDYCVSLPDFPGVFPLVFVLKPAYQEEQGFVQNIQQMLSKLFYQDIVFGIVVSSISFQLSVIIKKDKLLHFASTSCMTFRGIQYPSNLDLKELNTMCTFVYRVLKWAKKAKCMIAT